MGTATGVDKVILAALATEGRSSWCDETEGRIVPAAPAGATEAGAA